MTACLTIDVEIYDEPDECDWHQAKYLVHGLDDVLWTNDPEAAATYLKEEMVRASTWLGGEDSALVE